MSSLARYPINLIWHYKPISSHEIMKTCKIPQKTVKLHNAQHYQAHKLKQQIRNSKKMAEIEFLIPLNSLQCLIITVLKS